MALRYALLMTVLLMAAIFSSNFCQPTGDVGEIEEGAYWNPKMISDNSLRNELFINRVPSNLKPDKT